MNGPQITVVGHLAWDPRARALAGGTAVTDFRIGCTPSRFDKTTSSWNDLETLWFTVTCWRVLAEHVAQSLKKGDRVVVTGRLTTRTYKTEQGELRNSLEIDASSVGMDLSRGPVTQTRVERTHAPTEGDPWAGQADDVDPQTGEVASVTPEQVAA